MQDLIERLEKATGPDRELDCYIWGVAVGPRAAIDDDFWKEIIAANVAGEGDMPAYTASIDAALTLVPEGWQWQVSNRAREPHTGRAYIHNRELQFAGVGGMRPNPAFRGHEITAATQALAICIVALKARSATPVKAGD